MRRKLTLLAPVLVLFSAILPAKPKQVLPKDQLAFGIDMAERGLWSEALFRFRQAEKLGDNRSVVFNNIAVAYEALGVFEKAEDYYRQALDVDPRNTDLRRNYSRFVEFYQSFKPDETEEAGAEGEAAEAAPQGESGEPRTGS